jgi:GrpB-like predicted nucleotidyltransferase (UPF0157 family)
MGFLSGRDIGEVDPRRPALAEDGTVDVPAVVVPYDPQWPQQFEELRRRVDAALSGLDHHTVHIGSTAVPGLAAKPIIDLDVVVADQPAAAVAVSMLAARGWQHEGDLGIAGREAFKPPSDALYHHLYLMTADSRAYRDHVDLRDFLRAHPGEAARYGRLKQRLAPLLTADRAAYNEGKAQLIAQFLTKARPDARSS